MIRTNFHTHTTYCDGKNSPREMIEAAIAGGFSAIGFSGHSLISADPNSGEYCMSRKGEAEYRREIMALKEEYRGRIAVYCGIEQDLFADVPPVGYDFVIGSAHYVKKGEHYLCVDATPEIFSQGIKMLYDGDPYALAEDYFRQYRDICADPAVDIVGHIDLLTKFNEIDPIFDEAHPRYIAAWTEALEVIADSGKTLEINSGAIPRGYRTSCYPAPPILKHALKLHIPILLSCDCHSADSLLHGWNLSHEYALTCGCTEADLDKTQRNFPNHRN